MLNLLFAYKQYTNSNNFMLIIIIEALSYNRLIEALSLNEIIFNYVLRMQCMKLIKN